MYTLEGGSLGFQIGAEATDLILLVMNVGDIEHFLHDNAALFEAFLLFI